MLKIGYLRQMICVGEIRLLGLIPPEIARALYHNKLGIQTWNTTTLSICI